MIEIVGWRTRNIPIDCDGGTLSPAVSTIPFRYIVSSGQESTATFQNFVVELPPEPVKTGYVFAGWELINDSVPTGYFLRGSETLVTQSGAYNFMVDGYMISNVWGSDQGLYGNGALVISDTSVFKAKWVEPLIKINEGSGDVTVIPSTINFKNGSASPVSVNKIIYKTSAEDSGKCIFNKIFSKSLYKISSINLNSSFESTLGRTVLETKNLIQFKRKSEPFDTATIKNNYLTSSITNYISIQSNEYKDFKNQIFNPSTESSPSGEQIPIARYRHKWLSNITAYEVFAIQNYLNDDGRMALSPTANDRLKYYTVYTQTDYEHFYMANTFDNGDELFDRAEINVTALKPSTENGFYEINFKWKLVVTDSDIPTGKNARLRVIVDDYDEVDILAFGNTSNIFTGVAIIPISIPTGSSQTYNLKIVLLDDLTKPASSKWLKGLLYIQPISLKFRKII